MQKKDFLRTIDQGFSFKFSNGKEAKNLKELLEIIKDITPEEFSHYVYFDHNDFSNWIMDVIEDEKLGRDIFHANQRQIIALLQGRIEYLKK